MATRYERDGDRVVKITGIGRFVLKPGGAEHAKALRWIERNDTTPPARNEKPAEKPATETKTETKTEDDGEDGSVLGLVVAGILVVGAAVAGLVFRRRNAASVEAEVSP